MHLQLPEDLASALMYVADARGCSPAVLACDLLRGQLPPAPARVTAVDRRVVDRMLTPGLSSLAIADPCATMVACLTGTGHDTYLTVASGAGEAGDLEGDGVAPSDADLALVPSARCAAKSGAAAANQMAGDAYLVPAVIQPGDHSFAFVFDAASWVRAATYQELLGVVDDGWRSGYGTDAIVYSLAKRCVGIVEVLKHTEQVPVFEGRPNGFEIAVSNTAFVTFLKRHRPADYARLRAERPQV